MFWTSLALPWQWCLEEAWAATCAGLLPIGAVVTNRAGRLLARGRNRLHEQHSGGAHLAGHRLAHAEMNALVALDHEHVEPQGCVLYTTTEPCPLCTGALRIMQVPELWYASRDPIGGSIDLLTATPIMRRRAIRVIGPQDETLEDLLVAMHVEVALRTDRYVPWMLDGWAALVPRGVALGRALHASGALEQMRHAGVGVAAMLDELARHVQGLSAIISQPALEPAAMRAGDGLRVVPYDSGWPALFVQQARTLRAALGTVALRIDHSGSTAVPGLAAKPVIDIQISVADLLPLDVYRGPLEALGYVFRADNTERTKRYFRESPGTRRTHIHVRRVGSFGEQFALLFRDFLRQHPDTTQRYESLKLALADQFPLPEQRHAYTEAKEPFIWETMAHADAWAQRTGWTPGPSDA
jgi:GrpB-like predicted nucleotidyltransferase (UPF0157 family)/tRNA(Arg) A34 adenosine deaminase TadA